MASRGCVMPFKQRFSDALGTINALPFLCIWIVFALLAITFAEYWPVQHFGFVNYDDNVYVYDNPRIHEGLTKPNIRWAFTTFETCNYIPLTWLSLLLDGSTFGATPAGLHIENVILHAANVALVFLFLLKATGDCWPSAMVAAIFALHPTHVESVAWISERKDVLSMLFFLLAAYAYLIYARLGNPRPVPAYLASLGLFGCGLLSKSMLVTFPFVLLLLDYWPLHRTGKADTATREQKFSPVTIRRAIAEKLPFIALSIPMSILEARAQQTISATLQSIPITLRAQNAVVSYASYLANTIWPTNLSVLYPYRWQIPLGSVIGSIVLLVLLTLLCCLPYEKRKYAAVGWLWFLGTLVPVIGVVQVGQQAMADRYLYLPSIGLSIVLIWSVPWSRIPAPISTLVVVAVLAAFAVLTRQQISYWVDSDTLFHHASIVLNGNTVEEIRLGMLAAKAGDHPAAAQHYRAALAEDPSNYAANFDFGNLLVQDNPALAIEHYQLAALKQPGTSQVQINWGVALMKLNNPIEAFSHFRQAESLDPDSYDAHYNLGKLFSLVSKFPEARTEFTLALKTRPDDANAKQALQALPSAVK